MLNIHTLLNLNRNSKVQALSSLQTLIYILPLTRPHLLAVRCKVIVGYFLTEGSFLESASLELGWFLFFANT